VPHKQTNNRQIFAANQWMFKSSPDHTEPEVVKRQQFISGNRTVLFYCRYCSFRTCYTSMLKEHVEDLHRKDNETPVQARDAQVIFGFLERILLLSLPSGVTRLGELSPIDLLF
jgi:hypothetical protein